MAARLTSITDLDFRPRSPVWPSPDDWRDVFIYFLLVDRFDSHAEGIPAYDPSRTPKGRNAEQGGVFQGGRSRGSRDGWTTSRGWGPTESG